MPSDGTHPVDVSPKVTAEGRSHLGYPGTKQDLGDRDLDSDHVHVDIPLKPVYGRGRTDSLSQRPRRSVSP